MLEECTENVLIRGVPRWVTFEVPPLSSFALRPTMLPLLEKCLEFLL